MAPPTLVSTILALTAGPDRALTMMLDHVRIYAMYPDRRWVALGRDRHEAEKNYADMTDTVARFCFGRPLYRVIVTPKQPKWD